MLDSGCGALLCDVDDVEVVPLPPPPNNENVCASFFCLMRAAAEMADSSPFLLGVAVVVSLELGIGLLLVAALVMVLRTGEAVELPELVLP